MKTKNKTCLMCEQRFRGRSDAKTCSDTCRKRLERNRKARAAIEAAEKFERES